MSQRIAISCSKQLPRALHARASATSYQLFSNSIASCPSQRFLSTTPALYKKTGKANLSHARSDSSPPVNDAHAGTAVDDAYDLSTMESQILKAIERLTHELSELRAGGRFNPELLEKLRVTLKPTGSALDGTETHRLGDLAQVIPKGRVISVISGDEEFVKPVMAAIQASPYSLTPHQPQPDQPTTFTVPIPPPTGETRKKALEDAKRAETTAMQAVQNARAAHQKKLRALEVGKAVRPDDAVKAKKLMDETTKKGQADVKHIADSARKVLESQ